MAKEKQAEIQIQCQKDWAILQVVHEDKKEGTFVYGCPICNMRYFLVPIELDSESVAHSGISHTQEQDQLSGLPLSASQANLEANSKKRSKSRVK